MSCERYTFEKCIKEHGIDATENEYDADLLCGIGYRRVAEKISFAQWAIFAYLISNIYIQVAECSVLLKKSHIWGKGKEHEESANRAIFEAFIVNSCIGLVGYVLSMVLVHYLVRPLDNRTNSFVVGISQIFAAIVFFMMSINIPQWFGIYHSNKLSMVSFNSKRGIRFSLSWNIWNQLFAMFFFNLYFSCADFDLSVVYGSMIGVAFGLGSIIAAMKARSKKFAHQQKLLAIIVILVYTILSWFCFFSGINYISDVWFSNHQYQQMTRFNVRIFLISLPWVAIIIIMHLFMNGWTSRKKRMGASTRFNSLVFSRNKLTSIIGHAFPAEYPEVSDIDNKDSPEGADIAPDDEIEKNAAIKKETESKGENYNEDGLEKKSHRLVGCTSDVIQESQPPIFSEFVSSKDAPSYYSLCMNKCVQSYPVLCCCLNKRYGTENISGLDYVDHAREKSKIYKVSIGLKSFLWYLCSFAALFFTIVNIGATVQQCRAKNQLGDTFKVLYPANYLNGTMCAWDAPGPNATIKTFESLQDVYDADYKVVHCGACGTCSNWNDITLQYTTRKVLAGISKVCAKKSFGNLLNLTDPNDPVVLCNHLRIGFTMPCAKSWAWDEVNTKNNAYFVFIQALISNFASDMQVTYQDITLATIDEAISGQTFVREVGATRRRMNIESDISRPISQQCTVIQQNWTEIFVDPFKPPVGGKYRIAGPSKPTETVVVIGYDSDPS